MNGALTVFARTEQKYLLTPSQAVALTENLPAHMEEDVYFRSDIRNLYDDTPALDLSRRSLDRPPYKEKVRLRSYGPAGAQDRVFLECKKKFEGVVYKRRAPLPLEEALALAAGERDGRTQVERELAYTCRYYNLAPQLYLAYDRLSYRGREDPALRLTLDDHIRYRWEALTLEDSPQDVPLLQEGVRLLEVKALAAMPLWLVRLLSELDIRQVTFSKYGKIYEKRLAESRREETVYV